MRGHDVIVFHLVDPAERDLPGDLPATFEDAESGALLPLRPGELREQVPGAASPRTTTALHARIAAAGADYVRLDTSEPLDRALHAYLDCAPVAQPGALSAAPWVSDSSSPHSSPDWPRWPFRCSCTCGTATRNGRIASRR